MAFLFELALQMFLIFFIIYIFQDSNHLNINIKHILLNSFFGAIFIITVFVFFKSNIILVGIVSFLVISSVLLLINFGNCFQILYFSSSLTNILFYVYFLFVRLLRPQVQNIYLVSFSYYFYSMFFAIIIICLFVYLFKIRFILPTGKINFFIIFISVSLLLIELLFLNQFSNYNLWNVQSVIIYIVLGFTCFNNIVVIQYLYNYCSELSKTTQNNFLSKVTESYVNNLKNEQHKIFKIKHDLKNTMIILYQLLCNNKISEAIEIVKQVDKDLKAKTNDIHTGNIIIDAYLSNLINNSNISIRIKSNDLNDLTYISDFVSLFINIVDNAVENAKKDVVINIDYKKDENILIKVSNDCDKNPINQLKKSRKGGDHGYGLKIVHDIIDKHFGTYITTYENNIFTTYIMLNFGGTYEK